MIDELEQTVVIVGAGPTGLSLGTELKRLGISSLILDRLATGPDTSRAAAIHARTLEVLEPLGVTSELIKEGLIIQTLHVREKNRILASISLKDLDTQYPFVLVCPQEITEAILMRRLQSLGGDVQRSCEVVAILPSENSVQVQFKNGAELKTVHTKWLVGCDGMHSLVREQASIPFPGDNYEEVFVLADVEMDWPLGREEANLFFSDKGLLAVIPMPGNYFRIIATVKEASITPSSIDFQQILKERGPENGPITIRSMVWSSRFHIQRHVAKVLRKGRILLAGDAAHVHSPAGGQGMNTGIQDAITLASALKETLHSGNDAELKIWEKKRLKIARSVLKLTDRLTKVVTTSSSYGKFLRNTLINIIGHIPFAEHALARKIAELDNR